MTALATLNPIGQFFDLDGSPLNGGKLYFGQANQNPVTAPITVYWDAAATQPAAQPIPTLNGFPVRSGTPAIVYAATDYSLLVQDTRGRQVLSAPNSADFGNAAAAVAQVTALRADLASTSDAAEGAGQVGFDHELNYALRTIGWELNRDIVRPEWFGAKFDGATDDYAAIQAAIDYACYMATAGVNFPVAQPVTVQMPAGDAVISQGLTANRRIRFYGQGMYATRLLCKTNGAAFYGFTLRPNGAGGAPIWGADIADFQIVGNAGSTRCNGLDTGSTAPYTVSQTDYRNLLFFDVGIALNIGDGVDNSFYQNRFVNIKATGSGATGVTQYGVKLNNAVYCAFENIEVTGVGASAYGFYGNAGWCAFTQMATDGVNQLDLPHSTIVGFTVEGLIAATVVQTTAVQINRVKMVAGLTLIDCPNAKVNYGLTIGSPGCLVVGMAVNDTGGGQPDYPFLPANGTSGTLLGFVATSTPPFKIESIANAATMKAWLWQDCAQITAYGHMTALRGSATYDPPNLGAGATQQTTVTVTGAAEGDLATATFSIGNAAIVWFATVTAADTVVVTMWNTSGVAVNLGSGTLRVCATSP